MEKMKLSEFAAMLGFSQPASTVWKRNGWLVLDTAGLVDVEASKKRLMEKRGHLRHMTATERSTRSGWSKGPHCKTHGGFASWERLKHER